MSRRIYAALLFVAVVAAGSNSSPPPSTQQLRNEPSRSDLFDRIVTTETRSDSATVLRQTTAFFNLYGPFAFPSDTRYDVINRAPRTNGIFGIDISHYTAPTIPIEQLWASNVQFVYAKASQGTKVDGTFVDFWRRLGALPEGRKIHRGAFHFLSATTDVSSQANTFLTQLTGTGGLRSTDMPPVLDVEWDVIKKDAPDRWAQQKPEEIVSKVVKWLTIVQSATGRVPMIYTCNLWWQQRLSNVNASVVFANYPVWIADYSRTSRGIESPVSPSSRWALWQFTSKSQLTGSFDGALDASIFKGTPEQFASTFHVTSF